MCQHCRGGIILYRTFVNASVAVAGAVLHLGGAVHDVAQVPQPRPLAGTHHSLEARTRLKAIQSLTDIAWRRGRAWPLPAAAHGERARAGRCC